jgi:hypothetical protein
MVFTEIRRNRQGKLAIPYTGWMRWHYISGAVFGLTTLGFAYSGLLSMEPFAWTNAEGLDIRRDTFTGGALQLAEFPAKDAAAWAALAPGRAIKEVEFRRIQDEPYYVVRYAALSPAEAQRGERLHQPYNAFAGRAEDDRLLVHAATLEVRQQPFSTESLMARLKAAVPDVPVREQLLLTDYDSYYYSPRGQTPLPVLRVKFEDPLETWAYIDPATSQVVTAVHRLNRLERWLYSGLHNFDFRFLYDHRPLWDITMLVLCLGGLASSGIGLWFGVRRVVRGARRTAAGLVPPRSVKGAAE